MSSIKLESKSRFGTVHIAMIRAVLTFCFASANVAITNSIAMFGTLMTTLQGYLTLIDSLRTSIAGSITGYAAQKRALKRSLAVISNSIMKAAYSYAIANGDLVLAAQMKTSMTKLDDMKDEDLGPFAQFAINTVTPIVSSLSGYGVTGLMVDAWQAACTAYIDVLSNPKNAITARKAINTQIQTVLRESMLLLYMQADELAFGFKDANLTYYNNYRDNRKLYPHHVSTQLRAFVVNGLGLPVTEGEVIIEGTDRSAALDSSGYALVDHIPFGVHIVQVTTAFGNVERGPIDFKKGHVVTIHFQVGAIPPPQAEVVVSAPVVRSESN